MPTTTYTTPTMSVNAVGARTDAAGAAVNDFTAEEARFPSLLLSEGYLKPTTAFKVNAQAVPNMTVKVGSDTAKADYYAIAGEVGGQGNYITRLDVASQNVTIDAADASQTRTDEIYLVVRDNVYDASARALPQLGYRKGDLGGANPGPDSSWRASVILARITVAASATTITNANITDLRTASAGAGISATLFDAKGDILAAPAADTVTRVPVGPDGQVLWASAAEAAGVGWAYPNMRLLADVALVSTAGSVLFGSIPQTHKHLMGVIQGKRSPEGFAPIKCRQNGISTNAYESQVLYAAETAVVGLRVLASTSMEVGIIGDDNPCTSEFIVADYTNATDEKLYVCRCAYLDPGAYPVMWQAASHLYTNVAPVTQLQFFPSTGSFAAGTRISLYGLS